MLFSTLEAALAAHGTLTEGDEVAGGGQLLKKFEVWLTNPLAQLLKSFQILHFNSQLHTKTPQSSKRKCEEMRAGSFLKWMRVPFLHDTCPEIGTQLGHVLDMFGTCFVHRTHAKRVSDTCPIVSVSDM
jgi:hypothetical protein